MISIVRPICFTICSIFSINSSSAISMPLKCTDRGGYDEAVCSVSMVELIASPDKYDNAIVEVQGFFIAGSVSLLFVDEGAAKTSRTVDSIVVNIGDDRSELMAKLLSERDRKDLVIFGRFSAKTISLERFGAGIASGAISVTEVARPMGPWGVPAIRPPVVQ